VLEAEAERIRGVLGNRPSQFSVPSKENEGGLTNDKMGEGRKALVFREREKRNATFLRSNDEGKIHLTRNVVNLGREKDHAIVRGDKVISAKNLSYLRLDEIGVKSLKIRPKEQKKK